MLSRTSQYALRSVLFIAENSHARKKVGVGEIAKALEIPKYYLAKILRKMAVGKLIRSSKGPGGGYYLDSEDFDHALISIIEMVDGPDSLKNCALGLNTCSSEHPCPIHFYVGPFRDSLIQSLSEITVGDALEQLKQENVFIANLLTTDEKKKSTSHPDERN